MMIKKIVLVSVIFSYALTCEAIAENRTPIPISIHQLLAAPEEMNGRQVEVWGILSGNIDVGFRVYYNRDAYAMRDVGASIRVVPVGDSTLTSITDCVGKYIHFTGIFYANEEHIQRNYSVFSYVEVDGVHGAADFEAGELEESFCWLDPSIQ